MSNVAKNQSKVLAVFIALLVHALIGFALSHMQTQAAPFEVVTPIEMVLVDTPQQEDASDGAEDMADDTDGLDSAQTASEPSAPSTPASKPPITPPATPEPPVLAEAPPKPQPVQSKPSIEAQQPAPEPLVSSDANDAPALLNTSTDSEPEFEPEPEHKPTAKIDTKIESKPAPIENIPPVNEASSIKEAVSPKETPTKSVVQQAEQAAKSTQNTAIPAVKPLNDNTGSNGGVNSSNDNSTKGGGEPTKGQGIGGDSGGGKKGKDGAGGKSNAPVQFSASQVSFKNKPRLSIDKDVFDVAVSSVNATFNVNEQGKITSISLATGNAALDKELKKQLRRASFHPFKQNGAAVSGIVTITLTF